MGNYPETNHFILSGQEGVGSLHSDSAIPE